MELELVSFSFCIAFQTDVIQLETVSKGHVKHGIKTPAKHMSIHSFGLNEALLPKNTIIY